MILPGQFDPDQVYAGFEISRADDIDWYGILNINAPGKLSGYGIYLQMQYTIHIWTLIDQYPEFIGERIRI